MFQNNIYYFMSIQLYIVFIEEIWVQINAFRVHVFGYFWVQSLRKLGAKYMDTFGCMSIPFGMSMARLGACMQLLGACLTVGSFA